MVRPSPLESNVRIVRGSFFILIDYILVVGFGVTYTVVIARLLGTDGYGILSTGLALLNIIAGIAGLGISGALTRLVSKYVALKRPGAVREILRTSLKYIAVSGLIFSVALIFLAGPIAGNIYHNPELTNVFRVVAITILPFLLFTALLGTFQGFQRMRYNLFTEGSSAVLRVPFAVGLAISGYFATGALLGTAMGMAVSCLLGFYLLFKLWPKSSEGGDGELSREIFGFALPSWAGAFAWTFVLGYGTLLLGYVTNFHDVGYYSSAFWITSFMIYIPGIVGVPLFPLVSELWTLKDREKLASTIKISAKIIFTILIPFIVAIAVFPEFILTLIYGKDFAAGANVLRILAIAVLFMSIKLMNDSILSGVGRPDVNARINALTAVLAVVAITPLAWFFGIQGAAAGFLIAQILASSVGIFFVYRLTGLTYSISVFRITALAAGVMLIFLIPLRYLAANFLQAVAIGVGALVIYALACLVLGAVEKDDVELLKLISSEMGQPRALVGLIRFLDRFAR